MKKTLGAFLAAIAALILAGCGSPTANNAGGGGSSTPSPFTLSYDINIESGHTAATLVQAIILEDTGYTGAYFNGTGADPVVVDAWQSVSDVLTVANADYVSGGASPTFTWMPNKLRLRLGVAGTVASPVVFSIKNIKITDGTTTWNLAAALTDTWLTTSFMSQKTGTPTLSNATVGGSPALKIDGTTLDQYGANCLEIQLSIDTNGDGSADVIDLTAVK